MDTKIKTDLGKLSRIVPETGLRGFENGPREAKKMVAGFQKWSQGFQKRSERFQKRSEGFKKGLKLYKKGPWRSNIITSGGDKKV